MSAKKWFVHSGKHQEGPFSDEEITGKANSGALTAQSFVWCEGMKEWESAGKVEAFKSFFVAAAAPPPLSAQTKEEPAQRRPQAPADLSALMEFNPEREEPTGADEIVTVQLAKRDVVKAQKIEKKARVIAEATPAKTGIKAVIVVSITVAVAAAASLVLLEGPRTAILDMLSSFPKVEDVSPENLKSLEAAAKAGSLGLAVSTLGLDAPSFYVSANLPDGSVVDLTIKGIKGSLSRDSDENHRIKATIQKKLGKTAPLKGAGGQSLPTGEYEVSAKTAGATGELVASQRYFLGGAKDAKYIAAVEELKRNKLKELKDYDDLSQALPQLLTLLFPAPSNKPLKKQAWADAQQKYLNQQITIEAQYKLLANASGSDVKYSKLFSLSHDAWKAIQATSAVQKEQISAPGDAKIARRLQEAKVQAESKLEALNAELKATERP